jgi:hypothetical protein
MRFGAVSNRTGRRVSSCATDRYILFGEEANKRGSGGRLAICSKVTEESTGHRGKQQVKGAAMSGPPPFVGVRPPLVVAEIAVVAASR